MIDRGQDCAGIFVMAGSALVTTRDQAIKNINRYQVALVDDGHGARLRGLMSRVHIWYAARTDGRNWLFAPSKFVGYANNSADTYVLNMNARDGRKTERVLQPWFHVAVPGTRQADALAQALQEFLRKHGHVRPHKGARLFVPEEISDPASDAFKTPDRIRIDPAICAGRPHIRGTRVRVSDILQFMAAGAPASEILRDYPYLEAADLSAALAYGAAATDHRIVLAA